MQVLDICISHVSIATLACVVRIATNMSVQMSASTTSLHMDSDLLHVFLQLGLNRPDMEKVVRYVRESFEKVRSAFDFYVTGTKVSLHATL